MSRTESHVPYWVQVFEHPYENHFHEKGDCDLPPIDQYIQYMKRFDLIPWDQKAWRCFYDLEYSYQKKHPTCNCYMCGWGEKHPRKTEKYKAIKEQLKELD